MPGTPQPRAQPEDVESSQDSQDSEDQQDQQCVEESLREESEAEEDVPCSQDETLHTRLAQFVKQRQSLHQTVLLQEPLWLKELYAQVKQAGIKCGLNQLQVSPWLLHAMMLQACNDLSLQDWLDVQCITYRVETARNKKKKKNTAKLSV